MQVAAGAVYVVGEAFTLALDDRFDVRVNEFLPVADADLFTEAAFFRLHAQSKRDQYLQLVHSNTARVAATLIFYEVGEGVLASPKRGTFGGLRLHEPPEVAVVDRFLRRALGHVRELGARRLEIRSAPLGHDLATGSVATNALLRLGFRLSASELNYELPVDQQPLEDKMSSGNRKRVRKCLREGFFATQVEPQDLPAVYALIRENRARRGFPMTMTEAQVEQMMRTFPERMSLFAVYREPARTALCAAAVCLAVTSRIFYVLYWADAPEMEAHSPVALLASCIYEHSRREGFQLLDVGTSTVGGEPNHGLITFKRNLGFSESLKLAFIWEAPERGEQPEAHR